VSTPGSVTVVERWRLARAEIDAAIDSWLGELPEASVVDAARYIAMGGKRLRGFLVLEAAESLGASRDAAIDAAVAVELVHAASLALDDIIDEDVTRRGFEAAWVRFGLKKTVMVSNLLIPFAQRIVEMKYGGEALERTVAAWLDISRGEVIDAFLPPEKLAPETYMEMIRLKTGALFRLSAELGVLAAGRRDLLEVASHYGETLGIVYQIADDIRDSRDPRKLEREPSLRLFIRWMGGDTSKPLDTIERLIREAESLAEKMAPGSYTLRVLPRFIVNAMLANIDGDGGG